MAEAGQVSTHEISVATEQLAEARARVLERQREGAQQAGGDIVTEWNRELLSLSVDERELAARVQQIDGRLDRMRMLADSLDDLRRAQEEIERSREALERARESVLRASEEIREMQSVVAVRVRAIQPERREGAADQDSN
jgi:hypothetical protein